MDAGAAKQKQAMKAVARINEQEKIQDMLVRIRDDTSGQATALARWILSSCVWSDITQAWGKPSRLIALYCARATYLVSSILHQLQVLDGEFAATSATMQ